jgi:hypothetical protein
MQFLVWSRQVRRVNSVSKLLFWFFFFQKILNEKSEILGHVKMAAE